MKVGIIGGGFAGMASAYELGKRGYQTVLIERMPELGGLAGTFPIEGARLERGYHHWFTSDTEIIGLMEELGLGDRVMWIPSKVGLLHGGKWNCDCQFFSARGVCSHTMALERVLEGMLPVLREPAAQSPAT